MNNYIVYNKVECICISEPESPGRHVREDGNCFYCGGEGYKYIPVSLSRALARIIEDDAFIRHMIKEIT